MCTIILTPPPVYRNQSVCPRIRVQPIAFLGSTLAYHILHMVVSPWDNALFMIPIRLTSRSNFNKVFDMFSCLAHNYLLIWHWPTTFSTCVYHHKKMCHVHSWSNTDLWPQGQTYSVLLCLPQHCENTLKNF